MSVLLCPETLNAKDVQIWNNAAFDNGESEGSMNLKLCSSTINPLLVVDHLSQSLQSDSTKENHSPSMVESPVLLKSLAPTKPLHTDSTILNAKSNPVSKQNISEERNLDSEIEEIEKEISWLSSRLESLRLEKARRNSEVVEKRGKVVAARFMDPPKQKTDDFDEHSKIEESKCTSAKFKTPRKRSSMGPSEVMRGSRRGISLGPAEIYSATKLKQLGGKQEVTTPVQPTSNRRKSCYWRLQDIDELRVTKERGKSASLSPKSRPKTASKVQAPKQAATTIGSKKRVKKEDGMISLIRPNKLFLKDCEKSAPTNKPLKSGRTVASRYNQISNGGNSAVKDVRKRSLTENDEDLKRIDMKRASLAGKSQRAEQQATENRAKKRWEIPTEVTICKVLENKTPFSVSKMLDVVPKIKTFRCKNESRRDSGPAKRVSELVGRKSYFNMDVGYLDEAEESVCVALSFGEEHVVQEYPKIKALSCIDESPPDNSLAKEVPQLVGKISFFDDDQEMPVFSFEGEDGEGN